MKDGDEMSVKSAEHCEVLCKHKFLAERWSLTLTQKTAHPPPQASERAQLRGEAK